MSHLFFLALLGIATLGASEHFALKDDKVYCILMDVDFEGQIQYLTTDNKTVDYKFNVTTTGAPPEGSCLYAVNGTSASKITIAFFPNNITPHEREAQNIWEITFVFTDRGDNGFELSDYSLKTVFYPEIFKDSAINTSFVYEKDPAAENTVHWTKDPQAIKGFSCSSVGVSFKNESKLTLNNLKVLPFAKLEKDEFPAGMALEKCPMDMRTSDIVPIVVGACLAGLVIIVLVAYLIGRARAKRQGYASV